MKSIKCDKCGKDVRVGTEISVFDPRDPYKEIDLCRRCYRQFEDIETRQNAITKQMKIRWLQSKTEPEEIRKSCSTCKYRDNGLTEHPCDVCMCDVELRIGNSWYSKWEKIETPICCATCKYGSEETKDSDFPDECSNCDIRFSNWVEDDDGE